ncbi:MAG: hypothetical protein M1826_006626 [Phylliscum demangeonii]|nr:MAG: hypothetical protein M1826_006626 [Phylliscum demangeonii]
MSTSDEPLPTVEFHKERHVRYWLRCLQSLLPMEYTANDSNRITLAFFIICALDLLDALETRTTPAERKDYVDWIYHCQHPAGGFRGSTILMRGDVLGSTSGKTSRHHVRWDTASLPNSYFALTMLVMLGDDLGRVRRREGLRWLSCLQRPDGSFGAELGPDGGVEGGRDMRFSYWAAGFRWFLRGKQGVGGASGAQDIDVDALVGFINLSETYDHGFSEAPGLEAHGTHL